MKYMLGFTILTLLVVLLSGCGVGDKIEAGLTGSSRHCEGGVEYIQFARGASVMYNTDGSIKTCK